MRVLTQRQPQEGNPSSRQPLCPQSRNNSDQTLLSGSFSAEMALGDDLSKPLPLWVGKPSPREDWGLTQSHSGSEVPCDQRQNAHCIKREARSKPLVSYALPKVATFSLSSFAQPVPTLPPDSAFLLGDWAMVLSVSGPLLPVQEVPSQLRVSETLSPLSSRTMGRGARVGGCSPGGPSPQPSRARQPWLQ